MYGPEVAPRPEDGATQASVRRSLASPRPPGVVPVIVTGRDAIDQLASIRAEMRARLREQAGRRAAAITIDDDAPDGARDRDESLALDAAKRPCRRPEPFHCAQRVYDTFGKAQFVGRRRQTDGAGPQLAE